MGPVKFGPPEPAGVDPASPGIGGIPDEGPFGVTLSRATAETVITVWSSSSLPLFPEVLPLFLAFPRAGDRSTWNVHAARRLLVPDCVRPELVVVVIEVGVVNTWLVQVLKVNDDIGEDILPKHYYYG